MHFLDSWTELTGFDLARLLVPLGLLVATTLLPGRRIARVATLAVAAAIPFLRELGTPPLLTLGWEALWLLLAFRPEDPDEGSRRPLARSRGVLESGAVGLMLGLVLGLLMLMAVARQDLSTEESRSASYGVTLVLVGLLHLMIRRHIRRAMTGFAALGLGLQILDSAAEGGQVAPAIGANTGLLLASWLAVVAALRVAGARERFAGTAWVSDAHDLHD